MAVTMGTRVDEVGHASARGGLRDGDHLDAQLMQGGKYMGRRRCEVFQFRHIDGQQQQVLQRGDGFDMLTERLPCDERAGLFRGERRKDADWDAARDRGTNGAWVKHLGAEVSEFLRFVVADRGDDARIGDFARVSGEDAGDIGPDLDLGGIQSGPEQGGRVIGSSTTEGGGRAIRSAADEAGEHNGGARGEIRQQRSCLCTCAIAIRASAAVTVIGGEDAIGEGVDSGSAARAKRGGHHHAHRLFAGGDDAIREPGRDGCLTADLVKGLLERGMELIDLGQRTCLLDRIGDTAEDIGMLVPDRGNGCGPTGNIASACAGCCLQQQVGDAGSGGDHCGSWQRLSLNNLGGLPDAICVSD